VVVAGGGGAGPTKPLQQYRRLFTYTSLELQGVKEQQVVVPMEVLNPWSRFTYL